MEDARYRPKQYARCPPLWPTVGKFNKYTTHALFLFSSMDNNSIQKNGLKLQHYIENQRSDVRYILLER